MWWEDEGEGKALTYEELLEAVNSLYRKYGYTEPRPEPQSSVAVSGYWDENGNWRTDWIEIIPPPKASTIAFRAMFRLGFQPIRESAIFTTGVIS